MVFYWPIVQTTAAAFAALLIVVAVEVRGLSGPGAPELLALLAGFLYTQLFEHVAHRFPMHRRIRFLEGVRMSHLKHHRVLNGARFQTRRPQDADHIAGRWWIFPVLLLVHYAALLPFLEPGALVWFLAAATSHYVVFEISHWFTHVEDNAFDRAIEKIPFLRDVRARQIEHHRLHHEVPEVAFNFNPPYLGDRLTQRMPRHAAALGFAFPGPSEPAIAPAEVVTGAVAPTPAQTPAPAPIAAWVLRLWQRPAIRTASAIAAGVAGVAVIGAAVLVARSMSAGRQLTVDGRPATAPNATLIVT